MALVACLAVVPRRASETFVTRGAAPARHGGVRSDASVLHGVPYLLLYVDAVS